MTCRHKLGLEVYTKIKWLWRMRRELLFSPLQTSRFSRAKSQEQIELALKTTLCQEALIQSSAGNKILLSDKHWYMILRVNANFNACLKQSAGNCMCFPGTDHETFPALVVVTLLKKVRCPSVSWEIERQDRDRESEWLSLCRGSSLGIVASYRRLTSDNWPLISLSDQLAGTLGAFAKALKNLPVLLSA